MKNREIHIVGNWKMNQSLEDIKNFFVEMTKMKMELRCQAWIAPQFIHIPILKELAFTTGSIQIGAQNCADQDSGALTGEVSPKSLSDLGVDFVIIGHSERRTLFGENNELLNRKVLKALSHKLKTIYCVGETLSERESGKTLDVIKTQLEDGLKGIEKNSQENLIIAYEPVWAIGTGKNATAEEAQAVHAFIRKTLNENLSLAADKIVILYGGSVKPDNIHGLLSCPDIDGALVGGASLKPQDYKQLCIAASQAMM